MPKKEKIKAGLELLKELGTEVGANAVNITNTVTATASQAVPNAASLGVGGVLDGLDTLKAGYALGKDGYSLAKQAKSEYDFKAAKKDPEIQQLLGMRSYANGMLMLQHAAESQARQQMARLDVIDNLGVQLDAGLAPVLPDDLSPDEAQMLSMNQVERTQAINNRRQDLGQQINGIQQAAAQLDQVVNFVNSHPRISNAAFRKLEAKHDLEKNLGKTGLRTVRDMMEATKSSVSMAGNFLGTTATAVTVAGVGGAIASTALGAASAGATIASGAMMIAGGTADMAVAAYQHHEKSIRQAAAGMAAADSMQMAQNAANPEPAMQMAFAMNCVEETARQGKNIEKLRMARNAGVIVAGAGVTTIGTGALLSVVGAAGYGAAAAPGLILTGVGGGIAAVGGGVALGAQVGIMAYKHHEKNLQKQDVAQARLALEGQDIMSRLAVAGTPAEQQALEAQITPEHLQALDGMKQGLKTSLRGLGVAEDVIASQLNDAGQVARFAACVMIQRDPNLASETIARAALNECQGAFVRRAQGVAVLGPGHAVNIVEADLPQNTPAINALRRLGMNDHKITQTMNALASHDTEKIAQKAIQKKTGLK